jgi:hypothetical protein
MSGLSIFHLSDGYVNGDKPVMSRIDNAHQAIQTSIDNNTTFSLKRLTSIGIVYPSFTAAAYTNNSFYTFYKKYYYDVLPITSDLNLLTGKIPLVSGDYSPSARIVNHVKHLLPRANIVALTDSDIHENKTAGSDILILFHQEYVTQQEYDNLKNFVRSGGTLIVMDGNVFYAEVSYDKVSQTVTLIRGHGWAFDGRVASRDGLERWANETSDWLGSNFYSAGHPRFTYNPFDKIYISTHEQYITNPEDKIIVNYGATSGNPHFPKPVIATYEKSYGSGRIIVVGLSADFLYYKPKFLAFFDSLLLRFIPTIEVVNTHSIGNRTTFAS